MRTDRSESKNLASAQPGKAGELAALWKRKDEEFVSTREKATASRKEKLDTPRTAGGLISGATSKAVAC